MRVYIAGPMRGYVGLNFLAFDEAAAKIRAAGHTVFNPAENPAKSLRANLAIDTNWICLVADIVVLLPGWQGSLGAQAEYALARCLGIQTIQLEEFLQFMCGGGRERVVQIDDV